MSPHNKTQAQIKSLKSLAASIAHETRNPLSQIKSCCQAVQGNLEEAMNYLNLLTSVSNRGLSIIDIILNNIHEEEINKDSFVNLSISNIVKLAIKEYGFEEGEEEKLVNY